MSLSHSASINLLKDCADLLGRPVSFDGLTDDSFVKLDLRIPIGLVRRLAEALPAFDQAIEPLDADGNGDHVMDLEEWRDNCAMNYLTDWDGEGYYAKDGKFTRDLPASPRLHKETPPLGATHVVWFNK